MRRNTLFLVAIFVAFSVSGTRAVFAGATDVGTFDPGFVPNLVSRPDVNDGGEDTLIIATDIGTAQITNGIASVYAICARLPQKEYTVDCLGERMAALAASLPDTGDYADVKKVLDDTAQKLRQVAQRNKSTTQPSVRLRVPNGATPVVTAPLVPVQSTLVAASVAEAVAILDEAETRLLRSTASSDRRKVHYQAMAAAIGSNKILLRAA